MNFNSLLKFIYYVAKFSGVIYITIDFSLEKVVIRKLFWNTIKFALSFGFSLIACSFDVHLPVAHLTHSKILEIGVSFIVRLTIWMTCFLKLSTGINRRSFYEIMSNLQCVDEKVRFPGIYWMNSEIFSFLQLKKLKTASLTKSQILTTASVVFVYNFFYIFISIFLTFLFKLLDFNRHANLKNQIFIYLSVFSHFEFSISLMMLLSCGYYQLLALNDHIRKCIENQIESSVQEVIIKTRIIYDKLCDIFETISAFYLIGNLAFLLGLTYFNVCFYYSMYVFFKAPSEDLGYFVLVTNTWCMYFSPCVIWITLFSSWIESEGKKTVDLVQLLANKDRNLKSLNASNFMVLLTAHRKPRVFCGLFDFNWQGLFAMICSVFSFSIIVIQFYDVSNE